VETFRIVRLYELAAAFRLSANFMAVSDRLALPVLDDYIKARQPTVLDEMF